MTTALQPGVHFAGRYQLGTTVGAGGFASVWLAHDLQTNQRVALKLLEPDRADEYDPQTRARFQREAHILARLHDPHTVKLLDHGEADGRLYIVFELVPGCDLADLLETRGRLSAAETVHVIRQVLMSLREAHSVGLIHRDIKPQNIRVYEADGDPLRVKVLDFGIARASDDGAPSVTRTGEIVGTPRYMSPEQLKSQPLTPATDVYSVGMVMFELLAGTQALPGSSIYDQFDRLATGHLFSAPELEHLGALTPILKRMCARETQDRFPSAAAVLSALDAPRQPQRPLPTQIEHQVSDPPASQKQLVTLAVVLFLVAITGGLAAYMMSASEPNPPPPEPEQREPTALVRSDPEPPVAAPNTASDAGSRTDDAGPTVDAGPTPRAGKGAVKSAGCGEEPPRDGLDAFRAEHFRFLPRGYNGKEPLPLIVMLHSDYQEPDYFMKATDFPDRADKNGFILLALRDSAFGFGGHAWRDGEGDVTKVVTLVQQAMNKFCVDRARVFILGHGDGGRIAHRVSCRESVAAIASNSFSLAHDGVLCDRPVPTLWLQPMDSVHLPKDGSPNCSGRRKRTPDEMEKMWRKRNKCRGAGKQTVNLGKSTCRDWDCKARFEMCRLDGGVPWPGTSSSSWTSISGCAADRAPQFPTSARVWEFFLDAPPLADVPELF